MNTKKIIDKLDKWMDMNYPDVTAKKIDGDRYSTVDSVGSGSYKEAAHLKYMINEMRKMEDTEKLMRWIGFMQGALWGVGYFSINKLRTMNSDEQEETDLY